MFLQCSYIATVLCTLLLRGISVLCWTTAGTKTRRVLLAKGAGAECAMHLFLLCIAVCVFTKFELRYSYCCMCCRINMTSLSCVKMPAHFRLRSTNMLSTSRKNGIVMS